MGIVRKRNGKILMILGVLFIVFAFFGIIIIPRSVYEQAEQTRIYPWYTTMLGLMFMLGPIIAVVGIPLFIIGAKRMPSKLILILKSCEDMRAKISFLAQQLAINEKDVISTISRLKSRGEPVSIDDSTFEALYAPTLSPPTRPRESSSQLKVKRRHEPSMTLYEKLGVILTIISIIVSIIVALLKG